MSFIISDNAAYIYAKLTETGRKLLAQGALTYDLWVFGDSEIDYGFASTSYDLTNNVILRPKDRNPNIKYPIASVLGSDIFNILPAVSPIPKVISNVAETRGFIDNNNVVKSSLLKGFGSVSTTQVNGGTGITIAITSGSVGSGDTIMFQFKNTLQSTSSGITTALTIPYLFYRVKTATAASGTTNITVDRVLPTFGSGSVSCNVYVFPGGNAINTFYGSGTTTPYWNEDTLTFDNNSDVSNDDVPVWNFTAIFTENLAGVDVSSFVGVNGFNSLSYAGFKEYLNDTSQNKRQKSIGIIHYSNNTISNYYGEGLKTGTFKLNLPTVLWHKISASGGSGTGSQIGLILSSQTNNIPLSINSTSFGTDSIPFSTPFDILVDNKGNIVGKVFLDLKLAVIEDEELVAAMSYKSNRNWTLPTLNGSFTSATSESQGLIGLNQEVHVTYLLSNETGTGYTTGLHCQNYLKINRGGASQNNINVTFPVNQFPYMKAALTATGGFTCNKLYMLVQTVLIGNAPVSNGWKKIDVTSLINGYTSGNINPLNIESSSFTINLATYNAAPSYVLNTYISIPTIGQSNVLQFGDESFLFGNVDTQITATAFKSSFIFSAPSAQFISSVNPTYNSANNDSIYISEVGIYNAVKQLVAIGKISSPLKKKSSDTIQLQLEIDF